MVPPSSVMTTRNTKERNWGSLCQALATARARRTVVKKNSIIATSERGRTTRAPAIVHSLIGRARYCLHAPESRARALRISKPLMHLRRWHGGQDYVLRSWGSGTREGTCEP